MASGHSQNMEQVSEAVERATSGIKKLFVFRKSAYEQSVEKACDDKQPKRLNPVNNPHGMNIR